MTRKMRRTDRLMSPEDTLKVLKEGEYGILATVNVQMQPYAIPVNYVYAKDSVYFHCTNAGGHKYENITDNSKVSFTVVGNTKVLPEKFGTLYESAIVFGETELVTDEEERLTIFREFIYKYSADFPTEGEEYIRTAGPKALLIKINTKGFSGKHRV